MIYETGLSFCFLNAVTSLKDADGMANSADPDQTAPLGSLIWVYTDCSDLLSQYLKFLL